MAQTRRIKRVIGAKTNNIRFCTDLAKPPAYVS